MQRLLPLVLVVVVLGGFFGWKYRAPLMARLDPPPSAAHPAEKPDVLYSWVDKDGVTHFSQESGRSATRLEYDGSRITPLEPVPEEVTLAAVTEERDGSVSGGQQGVGQKGSKMLHDLRRELQENHQLMHENRPLANDL